MASGPDARPPIEEKKWDLALVIALFVLTACIVIGSWPNIWFVFFLGGALLIFSLRRLFEYQDRWHGRGSHPAATLQPSGRTAAAMTTEDHSSRSNPVTGLVWSSAGAALFLMGFLLSRTGSPPFQIALLVSIVPLAIGTIVSSREKARTGSKYATYGVGIGCLCLVAYVAVLVWTVLYLVLMESHKDLQ